MRTRPFPRSRPASFGGPSACVFARSNSRSSTPSIVQNASAGRPVSLSLTLAVARTSPSNARTVSDSTVATPPASPPDRSADAIGA